MQLKRAAFDRAKARSTVRGLEMDATFVSAGMTRSLRSMSLALACVLGATFGAYSTASANIYEGTSSDAIPGGIQVTAGYTEWILSCNPNCNLPVADNSVDTGPTSSSPTIEAQWLTDNAGWGTVTAVGSFTTPDGVSGSAGDVVDLGALYSIVALKQDDYFLAFLYPSGISSFALLAPLTGQFSGWSHIAGFNPVPIPPALLLFGTALAGLGFLGRRRKQGAAVQAI
jgi:hypothetical protein